MQGRRLLPAALPFPAPQSLTPVFCQRQREPCQFRAQQWRGCWLLGRLQAGRTQRWLAHICCNGRFLAKSAYNARTSSASSSYFDSKIPFFMQMQCTPVRAKSAGCWLPGCTNPPVWLRRGAERPADKGLRLFERLQSASLSKTPLDASTAGCPQRSEGTQPAGSLFCGDLFFGETKKSASPAGASPGLQLRQRALPIATDTSP